VFVPLYFFHRYQVEACCKLVGGIDYSYQVKGDGAPPPKFLEPDLQREALSMILRTLSPEVLMIPEDKLEIFPPRAPGYMRNRESFNHQTGVSFDYLAAPAAAANLSLELLLHPERMNRMVIQHSLDPLQPGPAEVFGELVLSSFKDLGTASGYVAEVGHTIRYVTIDHMIRLAGDEDAYPQVRALARRELENLKNRLDQMELKDLQAVYAKALSDQIRENKVRYLKHLPSIPPGSPIGSCCKHH
jgi:hypothetical protein